MKAATVLALVAAGAAPMATGLTVDWLHLEDVERVLHGENVTDVANDVARREFSPDARITLVDRWTAERAEIAWGGHVRADPGKIYHQLRVVVENTGRLDMPVHARHFSAIDADGRGHDAEWGLAGGFDEAALGPGERAEGIVVFHVPLETPLVELVWEGEFAEARLLLAEGHAAREPDSHPAERAPTPAEDPDDWEDW